MKAPLRYVRHPGPLLAATSAGGLSPSRLFYITNHISGMQFLVDTGADISVISSYTTAKGAS